MTQEKLKQYIALKNEIKVIEDRIKELEKSTEETVLDTVSGSSRYFPYTKHTIVIEGVDKSKKSRINNLKQLLINRKIKANTLIEEIDKFVDTLDDSAIRQIIQLKYLEGYSWKVVARKVYGYPSENRARMKVERFFEKI